MFPSLNISWKSVKNFLIINSLLNGISYISSAIYNYGFVPYFCVETISNIFLTKLMGHIDKPAIGSKKLETTVDINSSIISELQHVDTNFNTNMYNDNDNDTDNGNSDNKDSNQNPDQPFDKECIFSTVPKENFKHEFLLYTIGGSFIKSSTHYIAITYILGTPNIVDLSSFITDIPLFIIKSFLFETIFDVAHYTLHRLLHSNLWMYKNIHKKHHKFPHPIADTSFYMHPADLILSYSVPLFFAICVLDSRGHIFSVTSNDLHFITTYLTYQEIAGHLGKQMFPTSSFSQCIWLPRILDMQLYTEDHNLHHTTLHCNYSKRFSLMDKIFGTYCPGTISEIKIQ